MSLWTQWVEAIRRLDDIAAAAVLSRIAASPGGVEAFVALSFRGFRAAVASNMGAADMLALANGRQPAVSGEPN